MLNIFKEHINTNFSFLKGKKILVAISGGIDSVALTHLLVKAGYDSTLAHCNFRLRGKESDTDEQFVKDLAKHFNIPFFSVSFDTKKYAKEQKLSTQMAARELRYNWFEKTREENQLDYIATAHHLDDNLETFVINFARGTGLNGLTGIPEIKENIIRPLLPFSREQIEQYAAKNKITWREDATNAKTAYQRNKIRHQIVPILKELNPNLLSSFKKTTQYLNDSQQIIDATILKLKENVIQHESKNLIKIDILKLKELNNPKSYLFELLKEFGFTEWNDVVDLLEAQPGKQVFSITHRLVKDRDFLLLAEINSTTFNDKVYEIKKNQEIVAFEHFKLSFNQLKKNQQPTTSNQQVILVDQDKLKFPLTLRKRQEGDYFYPLGMTGKKKLSKFFKDEKFSLIDKENTWLLCSSTTIIWVVGQRLDERFKIDESTKNILHIELIKE